MPEDFSAFPLVQSGGGSSGAPDDWSSFPLVRKSVPTVPEGKTGGFAANLGAGANEALAGTLGMPVDLATAGINAALRLPSTGEALATPTPLPMPGHPGFGGANVARINPAAGAAAMGAAIPPPPSAGTEPVQITNPIAGSENIKSLLGLVGADPRNVAPENDIQKLARGIGGGVAGTLLPYAGGRALIEGGAKGLAGLIGEALGGGAPAGAGGKTMLAGAGGNAAVGAAGGAAGTIAENLLPEDSPYRPLANMAGNLTAGGALGGAMALGKLPVNYLARQVADYARPMSETGREAIVGDRLRTAAAEPSVAMNAPIQEFVPGSAPTLYQATGDSGLGQLERSQRTAFPQPFLDRASEQNAARVGQIGGFAPEGANPGAVGELLRQHLSAIDQVGEGSVAAAREGANSQYQGLGGQGAREEYGAQMREQMETAKAAAKASEGQLWRAIDPNGTLAINGMPVREQAAAIAAEIPRTARPPEGEEAAVLGAARLLGTASPFSDFTALRSRVLDAIRTERVNGQTPALRRLQILRASIDQTLEGAAEGVAQNQAKAVAAGTMRPEDTMAANLAREVQANYYGARNERVPTAITALAAGGDNGVPLGSVPARGLAGHPGNVGETGQGTGGLGNPAGIAGLQGETQPLVPFDQAAAERYRVAAASTRQRAQTFNTGVTGQVLQSGPSGTPYRVPESQVPARVFSTPEGMQSYLGAGGSPDTLREALVGDLRRSATNPDGSLNVQRYQSWLTRRSDALAHFPELRGQLADTAQAQGAVDQSSQAALAQLRDFQTGAARHFLNAEPTQAVQSAFASRTPEADFRQLARMVAGDPDAKAGLQRAIADYISQRFIGNTEAGTSGIGTVKSDALQTFVRRNSLALAHVFSGEQLEMLRNIAADLQRSNRSLSSTKIPGQSNTAQDIAAAPSRFSLISQYLGHASASIAGGVGGLVVGGPHGAVEGMLGGPAVKAALDNLRRKGIKKTDQLLTNALLDPKRGQALMMKPTPANAPFIAQRLNQQINALLAAQAVNQTQH